MYTQSQPTLPSLTAAIGKGVVDSYSPSSLTNGDISQHQIKQEQDFEHSPPSLPPLRNTSDNQNNNNNHSIMSINQLCNDTESEYPEDVKEAAAVLENMKTNAVTSSPSLANVSSQPQQPQQPQLQSQQLEPRTNPEPSQLPSSPSTDTGFMSAIVKKTMSAYEQGKATSPFIKCATEMVEQGVSRFSKPVIEHFAIVDQYARGLNRNEKTIEDGEHGLVNNSNNSNNNNDNSSNHNNNNINNKSNNNDEGGKDDAIVQSESDLRKRKVMSENSRSSSPSYRNPSRSHRTSQSSGSSNSSSYAPYTYSNSTVSATTSSSSTGTRSRWQQMVIGTGAAVGAAGAAVSEESMKSLKYCLQWINYATQHIDAQIAVLREFIVNLTNPSQRAVVHTSSTSTLSSIKKEVIDTLRKVIEVVSKYAGACLPDHAKISVKNYILSLPGRWASINHTEHSSSPSPMSSPQLAPANGHPLNQTSDYARRLLSLATESLDMLRSVAGIFGETVGRAEALVEKLKAVGVTSGGASAMGNLHFDNIWSSQSNNYNVYSSSSTSSHSSSGRSRRSSNTVRMNNHGPRKHSRPTPPVHLDDDDSILNGHYSDSSSDSDVEPMRMEMDNVQKRALKNANAKSQQQHANGVIKKRKKDKVVSKKENDKMDLSS